ncbi:hypothetical protein ABN034_15980 [Actinopolymorpha sp. B11F2]|uniref:hypothetical protein n=1 Tax=Actinopolymorpha sp. B11F2 TaxID=3160862 RepID=UPI0032E44C7C
MGEFGSTGKPRETAEYRVPRRTLLAASVLGTTAMGTSTTSNAAVAASTPLSWQGSTPSTSELPLIGGPEFPIGLFWPPHPFATTVERYREIKDAGFTWVMTGNYLLDRWVIRHAMGVAGEVGLKMVVAADERLMTMTRMMNISEDGSEVRSLSRAEARTMLKEVLSFWANQPAFAGISFYDEPRPEKFETVRIAFSLLRELAPTLLPFANLFPGRGDAYTEYVRQFVSTVKPSVISFDRYPLRADGTNDPNYFDNWSRVRAEGLATGLPTWTYIQSVGHLDLRDPTAEDLLWQVNISLAYGAKGIAYFTYWTPDPARGEGYRKALVSVNGERTDIYDGARDVNTRWLRQVGRQLKPLVSEQVVHANDDPLPPGASAFEPDGYVRSVVGSPLVLGRFRSADPGDRTRWLLITNRHSATTARSVVEFGSASAGRIERYEPEADRWLAERGSHLDLVLAPGAATLLSTG